MIRLATKADAAHVNAIANHPDVMPWVSINGKPLDFTNAVDAVAVFITEHGAVLFEPMHDGQGWGCHIMFTPEGRGKHALLATKEAVNRIFKSGAGYITAHMPDDGMWAGPPRTFGFKKTGRVQNYVRGCGADRYVLTREHWRQAW